MLRFSPTSAAFFTIALFATPSAHALDLIIEGYRSLPEFQEIRQKIEENLPDGVFLVEKQLSRPDGNGRALFAVQPEYSADELRKLIPVLEFEKGKLTIVDSSASLIEARFERKPANGGKVQ